MRTIQGSEQYHARLAAHKRDDGTMGETLRRTTRGPPPDDAAGLLSESDAEGVEAAVERLRGRDRDRGRDHFEALGVDVETC